MSFMPETQEYVLDNHITLTSAYDTLVDMKGRASKRAGERESRREREVEREEETERERERERARVSE